MVSLQSFEGPDQVRWPKSQRRSIPAPELMAPGQSLEETRRAYWPLFKLRRSLLQVEPERRPSAAEALKMLRQTSERQQEWATLGRDWEKQAELEDLEHLKTQPEILDWFHEQDLFACFERHAESFSGWDVDELLSKSLQELEVLLTGGDVKGSDDAATVVEAVQAYQQKIQDYERFVAAQNDW
jgi:hypothetical protein